MPASSPAADRFLVTLEHLLAIRATDLDEALDEAADLVARALDADKVDAFVFEPATETLVAAGTSRTPMGDRQHAIGMARLPLANGGRTADVFKTGVPHLTGRADQDPGELRGLTEGLGIRSMMCALMGTHGQAPGVLSVASARPDLWDEDDLRFVEATARWVGMLAVRTELNQRLTAQAEEQGRRAAADELIAILAHDLRNHIGLIGSRLQLMRRWAERERQDAGLRHIREVTRGVDRLARLVSDLLDSARLDQGLFTLDCRPTELVALANEVAPGMAMTPGRVDVVACTPELWLQADPDRMRQALENLISNALKFSPDGVPVRVKLETERRGDTAWGLVRVIDQGPGIPGELHGRLFDRFAAGPGSPGLGLGLYVARSIASAHGGTLTVDSAPGKGACFTIAIPADAPAA
jgi:two-component system, OmpR family, sensor kinase